MVCSYGILIVSSSSRCNFIHNFERSHLQSQLLAIPSNQHSLSHKPDRSTSLPYKTGRMLKGDSVRTTFSQPSTTRISMEPSSQVLIILRENLWCRLRHLWLDSFFSMTQVSFSLSQDPNSSPRRHMADTETLIQTHSSVWLKSVSPSVLRFYFLLFCSFNIYFQKISHSPDIVFLQEVIPLTCSLIIKQLSNYTAIPAAESEYFTLVLLKNASVIRLSSKVEDFRGSTMLRALQVVKVRA